jgi:hypothetical protein
MNSQRYKWWVCEETGYSCVTAKNFTGTWNGYVGIDPAHPFYETDCRSTEFRYVEIPIHNVEFSGWLSAFDTLFNPPIRRWWFGIEFDSKFSKEQLTLLATNIQYFDARFYDNVDHYLGEI